MTHNYLERLFIKNTARCEVAILCISSDPWPMYGYYGWRVFTCHLKYLSMSVVTITILR